MSSEKPEKFGLLSFKSENYFFTENEKQRRMKNYFHLKRT